MSTSQLTQLRILLSYSSKYEITVQFWPEQTTVDIAKDGIDLESFGGDFDFAIGKSIEYLDRINPTSVKWKGYESRRVKVPR
jgi:hypothetical protein